MYDIDSNIGFLGEILDDHSKEEFVMSENVRSRVERVYKSLVEERDNKPKMKFFDNTSPIKASLVTNLQSALCEICACLKSEGVEISADDVLRCITVYFKLIGLDRDPEEAKNKALFSVFGNIRAHEPYDLSESEDLKMSAIALIDDLNNATDRKFDDVDTIKENVVIIFKEIATLTNNVFDVITQLMTGDNTSPDYIKYDFVGLSGRLNNGNDERHVINISGRFATNNKVFVLDVLSTIFFDDIPSNPALAVDSFGENALSLITGKSLDEIRAAKKR